MKRNFFLLLLLAIILMGALYLYKRESELASDRLILYGNVDVRQVDLGFRVFGRVMEMAFQEGEQVKPGALIALLDEQPYVDLWQQSKAAVQSAKASLWQAEKLYQRRKGLVGGGGVSQEDYENALASRNISLAKLKESIAAEKSARTNFGDTKLYSPAFGSILTRIKEPGSIVSQGEPVYTLSLLSPVWIRTYVSEPQLGHIYPGMRALIHTDTPGTKVYEGHIGFISPVAEFTPKTVETMQLRTDLVYRLRVIADNPDFGLKQGMPVTVELIGANRG